MLLPPAVGRMRPFRVRGTSAEGAPGDQCKKREVVGFRGTPAEVTADPRKP